MDMDENKTPTGKSGRTRHFFYSCPGLDLWAVGKTSEEARRTLWEEIAILLMRCSKYSPLDKLLEDRAARSLEIRPS